jgi:hypothetical protein
MRLLTDGWKKDFVIKYRMFLEVRELGLQVTRAWDDSPGVLDLWGRLGVPVVAMPRGVIPDNDERVDNQSAAS